jgi:hypothetical protein
MSCRSHDLTRRSRSLTVSRWRRAARFHHASASAPALHHSAAASGADAWWCGAGGAEGASMISSTSSVASIIGCRRQLYAGVGRGAGFEKAPAICCCVLRGRKQREHSRECDRTRRSLRLAQYRDERKEKGEQRSVTSASDRGLI